MKGGSLGTLPGSMRGTPAAEPGAIRAAAAVPHPHLFQHGHQKGGADPLRAAPRSLPRPRTARIFGGEGGRGLSRDRALLVEALAADGWQLLPSGGAPAALAQVVLQIHLEVPAGHLFPLGTHNVLVPNPEWWRPEWAPLLRHPGVRVWAKTGDAERLFRALHAPVLRTGWRSADRLDPAVPRTRAFLHVAGGSRHKGTDLLLAAWRPGWPPLTVVSTAHAAGKRADNVTILGHLPEGELRRLQNACAFHLYPAPYEGYGHAEWEGLSCGAVVFCTAGAPFDEVPAFRPLAASPGARAGLIVGQAVSPAALGAAVAWAESLSEADLAAHRAASRAAWAQADAAAAARLRGALSDLAPQKLLTLQSPYERCGIAEYGRQLDQALLGTGLHPVALRLDTPPDALLSQVGPGTVLLVHFEPGLVSAGTAELLRKARERGARVVLCCHLFSAQVQKTWGPLVDRLVLHRPYPELAPDPRVVEIPLGCPEYSAPADRAALRAQLGLPADRPVLVTFGFLSPWKKTPEAVGALLSVLPPEVFLQVLTPPPFRDTGGAEAGRLRQVLAHHRAGPDRVLFSTDFRPEGDLLDRIHASDLAFLFHGTDTGSVSAATKSCVSARTPLVATGSTHASDLREGLVRVPSFQAKAFAAEVVRVLGDGEALEGLRAGMAREYGRLHMGAVAGRYGDLIRGLG